MIRSILAFALLLAATLAAQAQLPVQPKPPAPGLWLEHRPAGAGFRVDFPGTPVISSREMQTAVGQVTLHIATLEISPTVAYITMHNSYPAGTVGLAEAALDRVRDGMTGGGKRRILREERLKVSGMSATRLLVEEPGAQLRMQALVVVRGDDLFQAIFAAAIGGEDSPDGQRFLASFALVPR